MISTRQITRVAEAAQWLRAGEIIAFPTETVFGLGARFDDRNAVAKVFAAKDRPADNPLIVHLASLDDIPRVATSLPDDAKRLLDRFAPGPLTVLLPRAVSVPDEVTAGLDTVAVRVPSHPVARDLISQVGIPLVAPSANRSGRPSPTTWQAVWEDMQGRIAGVLLGEPTDIGLESTVVDCTVQPPRLLRSGGITLEALQAVCPGLSAAPIAVHEQRKSPGLRYRHYAPQAKVVLFDEIDSVSVAKTAALLSLDAHSHPDGFAFHLHFDTLEAYAREFFEAFRRADRLGLEAIYCQRPPPTGIGRALHDRLLRASQSSTPLS